VGGEPAPESTGDRQRRCKNRGCIVNGIYLSRPTALSSQFIQFLEMRREVIHIVGYLLLRQNELGVGDVVARRIPRAAPPLRLWGAFRMLSRHRHRQVLRRGKGSKDVSFLILCIVPVGPYFRLRSPTSGQGTSRKIHSKNPTTLRPAPSLEAKDIIPVALLRASNARCYDPWASSVRDQRPTQPARPMVCAEPRPAFPRPPLRTSSPSPN